MHFILEPFYKIVSSTISNEKAELLPIIKKLGIYLHKKDFSLDIKPLLKLVLVKTFGSVSCLVDSMVEHFPNAQEGTKRLVSHYYRNSSDDQVIPERLSKCDAKEPLCLNVVKLIYNDVTGGFYSFGRILSGTLKRGDEVRVLGEGYTLEEEEDASVRTASRLWIN